ncbi:hypothetical protein R3P38DRAFT_2772425 [Favolaschia claudopus]|uniref:Uncharacterized protein n=1 Tax=Favolaschia claudopus TaxID=2862362 RepID=A0AAW0C6G6_9AGAR
MRRPVRQKLSGSGVPEAQMALFKSRRVVKGAAQDFGSAESSTLRKLRKASICPIGPRHVCLKYVPNVEKSLENRGAITFRDHEYFKNSGLGIDSEIALEAGERYYYRDGSSRMRKGGMKDRSEEGRRVGVAGRGLGRWW